MAEATDLGSLLAGIQAITSSTESILTKSPFIRRTVGPSIDVTGATAAALPGCSILIWVPAAMNSPKITMEAGLIPAAARPVFLDLPYLSRKPPGREGCEKTGLPAIRSRRNLGLESPLSVLLVAKLSSHSH